MGNANYNGRCVIALGKPMRLASLLQHKFNRYLCTLDLVRLSVLNKLFGACPKFVAAVRPNTVTRIFQTTDGGSNGMVEVADGCDHGATLRTRGLQ